MKTSALTSLFLISFYWISKVLLDYWRVNVFGLNALSLEPFGRYGCFAFSSGSGSTIDFTNSWSSSEIPFSPMSFFFAYWVVFAYTVAFAFFYGRAEGTGLNALSLEPFGRYGCFAFSSGSGSTIDFTNSWSSSVTPFSPISFPDFYGALIHLYYAIQLY